MLSGRGRVCSRVGAEFPGGLCIHCSGAAEALTPDIHSKRCGYRHAGGVAMASFLWWSHIRLTSQPSVTPWVLRLCRVLAVWRYHTWISRTCLSLYESNGRDRCWLVVNEGFISGPRRSQSFVGRGRRTPAAGFVRRETRAARRVFVPSARESTVTTREGAKEAPLLLLRAQARTLYVHSCARWRSRARAGEGALPLGPPSNFLFPPTRFPEAVALG